MSKMGIVLLAGFFCLTVTGSVWTQTETLEESSIMESNVAEYSTDVSIASVECGDNIVCNTSGYAVSVINNRGHGIMGLSHRNWGRGIFGKASKNKGMGLGRKRGGGDKNSIN